MTSEAYWKIKTAVLERQVLEMQIAAATQQAAMKLALALQEAGLDPTATYTLDDATQTATPVAASKPQLVVDNSPEV